MGKQSILKVIRLDEIIKLAPKSIWASVLLGEGNVDEDPQDEGHGRQAKTAVM